MAHELTITAAGTAEMAYVGARPWHGLGNQLPAGASIDVWKTAAGMAWQIRRAAVRFFADEDTAHDCMELCEVPGETVLFRSDTRAPLGVVSPDYEIVQPGTVLEFFRDLVSDHGMQLESAGTLFGGRRFWALAKLAEAAVFPGDMVGGYLLLSTSADGTMATEARQTSVRVVCNNTLRLARAEDGGAVAPVKLSHRTAFCDRRVKAQLGLSRDNFERGMDIARALAETRVSDAAAQEFVRQLLRPEEHAQRKATEAAAAAAEIARKQAAEAIAIAAAAGPAGVSSFSDLLRGAHIPADVTPTPNPAPDAKPARAPRGEGQILELIRGGATGSDLPGVSGTAWGLVNAVTEYVDHWAQARTPDHRASSAWFGQGDELKTRALEIARTL